MEKIMLVVFSSFLIYILSNSTNLCPLKLRELKIDSVYQTFQNGSGDVGLRILRGDQVITILPCEYVIIEEIINTNLYAVYGGAKQNSCWAIFHKKKASFVTPFIYRSYSTMLDGHITVQVANSNKYGILDLSGKEVCAPVFDAIEKPLNGQKVISARMGDRYGFIDNYGKTVVPFEYESSLSFPTGNSPHTVLSKDKKSGLIDNYGRFIVLPKYRFLTFCQDVVSERTMDTLMAGINDKLGLMRIDETIIIPMDYDSFRQPTERLIGAELNSNYGFIDFNNKVIVPFIYKNIHPFFEGLAAVYNGTQWGFINKKGLTVIPFSYDEIVDNFSQNKALVRQGNRSFYIDTKGKFIKDY